MSHQRRAMLPRNPASVVTVAARFWISNAFPPAFFSSCPLTKGHRRTMLLMELLQMTHRMPLLSPDVTPYDTEEPCSPEI